MGNLSNLFGIFTQSGKKRRQVTVIILARVWQEDGVWNASAFDLPIAVFGSTPDDAVKNFSEALDLHFEVLAELDKLRDTVKRLKALAQDRAFYQDRIRERQFVQQFPLPAAGHLCHAA